MKPTLLIVDDDENICKQMKWALADEYDVLLACDRPTAAETVRNKLPEIVLLDLGLPPSPNTTDEGFAALTEMLATNPVSKVVVITGQGEKENALNAVGKGAYDFLSKPIDADELKVVLKRASYTCRLEREYREAQSRLPRDGFQGMLGSSPVMQEIFTAIRKVATTDVPVLILGESGTGKEMAALAVHRLSRRKEGPFVAINCTAIPETLLESELFGHEKGAFTGAHIQRKGRIEAASGGTLFLDEIGELPPSLQVKLLRFLQEQRLERVGGRQSIEIDTRVIAATNSDLRQTMSAGQFREDLYYRLAVFVIRMSPLREREGDVLLLAKTFLQRFATENEKKLSGFTQEATRMLQAHGWPGNVREMENRIKRAVIMAEGRMVSARDLELGPTSAGHDGASLRQAREAVERELVQRALAKNRGKISRAADDLGVSRPTLYELMDKLGIRKE